LGREKNPAAKRPNRIGQERRRPRGENFATLGTSQTKSRIITSRGKGRRGKATTKVEQSRKRGCSRITVPSRKEDRSKEVEKGLG